MDREKFLGVSFLKDKERDIALKENNPDETKSITDMRKNILETKADDDVELSNFKFQRFLNDKGLVKESREAKGFDISNIRLKGKQTTNELKLASGSMLEGFLSFYGIQLDKSLDKYEKRLHVIEENDKAFVGKVDRKGFLQRLSPIMEKERAKNKLKEFEQKQELSKKQDLSNEMEIQLERKKS